MKLPATICLAFPVLIRKLPLDWLLGVETVALQLNRRTFLGNLIWPQEDDTYPIYQDSYVTVRAAPTNHVGLTVRSVQHGFGCRRWDCTLEITTTDTTTDTTPALHNTQLRVPRARQAW